jgi:hypothetical protein
MLRREREALRAHYRKVRAATMNREQIESFNNLPESRPSLAAGKRKPRPEAAPRGPPPSSRMERRSLSQPQVDDRDRHHVPARGYARVPWAMSVSAWAFAVRLAATTQALRAGSCVAIRTTGSPSIADRRSWRAASVATRKRYAAGAAVPLRRNLAARVPGSA